MPVHYELVVENLVEPDNPVITKLAIDPVGPVIMSDPNDYARLATSFESAAEITGLGGTLSAGVSFVAGRHGQAALIQGAESITFPSSIFNRQQGSIELAVRLNRDLAQMQGYDRFFSYWANADEQLSVLVAPDLDAIYGHVMHQGQQHNTLASVTWLAHEWHHIAFTWGPEGQRPYLDGSLAAQNPSPAAPDAGGATIILGNDENGWGGIDALLDDFRLSGLQRWAPDELRSTETEALYLPNGT